MNEPIGYAGCVGKLYRAKDPASFLRSVIYNVTGVVENHNFGHNETGVQTGLVLKIGNDAAGIAPAAGFLSECEECVPAAKQPMAGLPAEKKE